MRFEITKSHYTKPLLPEPPVAKSTMTREPAQSATPNLILSPALPPLLYIVSSQPGVASDYPRGGGVDTARSPCVWIVDSVKLGQNNDMGK